MDSRGTDRISARRVVRLLAAIAAAVAGLAGATTAAAAGLCPGGARCGTVTVPFDRADPAAGTIDIAYAFVPHSDASSPSLGTVVPNPGGPGQSTIASAGLYLQGAPQLFAQRDLLLIDPRGTGGSGALTCPSLAGRQPLDEAEIARLCSADLGSRAGRYGSADVADDVDAVRAALGIDKLDLWGDSYGTFLMQVYAARHPEHVRSVVLDGAFPIESDPWGRDVLRGVRRVIPLVCSRMLRCSGRRALAQIGELAVRLRRRPIEFTAATPRGRLHLTLGERELANLTWAGGRPEELKRVPGAVAAALRHRFGPLKKLVVSSRLRDLDNLTVDPAIYSVVAGVATACRDYPRPYDLGAPPATRRAQYRRRLRALDRAQFRPFSPGAWLRTHIDAGPKCLDWPPDPAAGSGLRGLRMPDVPVLVMSGELDTNTPVEQGRAVAAQFPHATFAVVAGAGHTPALDPCGVALGVEFVERLAVNANRCRRGSGHASRSASG
jgi:pimeloyl-ACP methyl ester carboxylesterase